MFGFFAAEVSSCGDVFPRPSLGAERGKELDDDCDTFVLDADEDVREEEMQSSSPRAKTVLDPGQPNGRERKEHEATHAQCGSWCVACVRGCGTATKHFRHASAHEERMQTLVMECWYLSVGHEGEDDKGSWHVHGCVNVKSMSTMTAKINTCSFFFPLM